MEFFEKLEEYPYLSKIEIDKDNMDGRISRCFLVDFVSKILKLIVKVMDNR